MLLDVIQNLDLSFYNGKQKFLVKDIEVYSLETIKID